MAFYFDVLLDLWWLINNAVKLFIRVDKNADHETKDCQKEGSFS